MKTVIIKNKSGKLDTWCGVEIDNDVSYTIPIDLLDDFIKDQYVFTSVSNGTLVVNDGVRELSPSSGWSYLIGEIIVAKIDNLSEVGQKIWTHNSPKPELPGKNFYLQWTGAGDDPDNGIGNGDLLVLELHEGDTEAHRKIWFDVRAGQVWVQEFHAIWENAGFGDRFSASIVAEAAVMQPFVDTHYIILDDKRVRFVGPNQGTVGFAKIPSPVPNYDGAGYFKFDQFGNFIPANGDGGYDIHTEETVVARVANNIPVYSTTSVFSTFDSEDVYRIRDGYYIQVTAKNASNSNWRICFYMTVFRERTV